MEDRQRWTKHTLEMNDLVDLGKEVGNKKATKTLGEINGEKYPQKPDENSRAPAQQSQACYMEKGSQKKGWESHGQSWPIWVLRVSTIGTQCCKKETHNWHLRNF